MPDDQRVEQQEVKPGTDERDELSQEESASIAGGTVGSGTQGAGGGKATLNEFTITKNNDKSTP